MEGNKYIVPDSGCIDFLEGDTMVLPKPRVIKCGFVLWNEEMGGYKLDK